jgi:hypothetical protein
MDGTLPDPAEAKKRLALGPECEAVLASTA